jgi:apolipoprotein D and lipocalin family protein
LANQAGSGVMRPLLGLTALLAVASCGIVDAVAPSYREQEVTIASAAAFDAERYLGRWYEVARFPNPFQSNCPGAIADYSAGDGELLVRNLCLDANAMVIDEITGTATDEGLGRLSVRLQGVPVAAPYWVLWVDEGYRTAVVGAPNGRVGWILNRDPDIPEDRLIAAREVLDFNGYDVSQLQRSMTP